LSEELVSQISNNLDQGAVSISTSPTRIVEEDHERVSLLLYINSGTVYLGNSSVSTSNAIPFAAGTYIDMGMHKGEVYGIVASGTGEVRVLELKE